MDQIDHIGNEEIIDINIEDKMKKSYLLYSMSVIVSRALPDVRDGLKPVHRRIIYAMDNLKIGPRSPYRKSATVVGDVLGKYHPHGDSSVYGAMVRLAQEFNMRYPLVDGHGNFGSVDGDSAAAMRYTEVRMTSLTLELLRDIEKNTIDYSLNFDETLEEPKVLPSRFPNLLVNGSSGIAVGMATNIPPHNLGEVIDGINMLIENKDVTIDELMTSIKGPDFPTGGSIMGMKGVHSAYKTGRGKVLLRAVTHIDELPRGRSQIVITELPYQVNKARLIERIAEYVRDKKLEGITDIKDESDRDGTRVTIDVSRDANPQIVLNNLYKYTQLQTTFGIIMLALVDNEPVVLNLKQILEYYLEHQINIIRRRTQHDLDRAERRAHIVEGLQISLNNIDEIIKIIRGSFEDSEAEKILIEKYELTKEQTKAILDMTLRRLTGLEKGKLDEEHEDLTKTISEYKKILANEDLILEIIQEDLLSIKDKFNDDRRTDFKPYFGDIDVADMIDEENVVLTLTRHGYIKRMPQDIYKTQNRGGRGVMAMTTRDDDFVENLSITSTHDTILFFTNKGKTYSMRAFEIPESGRQARGTPIVNLLDLEKDEKITAMLAIKEGIESENLVFSTKQGLVKRVDIEKFENIRSNGLIAITLNEDDELIDVKKTEDKKDIILVTKKGKAIRFKEEDVNIYGRQAKGVIGIRLEEDDEVVSMGLAEDDRDLFVISENGYGKRTSMKEYRSQGRGGRGVLTYRIQESTGDIVSGKVLDENDEIMIITRNGIMIRIKTEDISQIGRNTRGVTLIRTEDDEVVAVARHYESEMEEELEESDENLEEQEEQNESEEELNEDSHENLEE